MGAIRTGCRLAVAVALLATAGGAPRPALGQIDEMRRQLEQMRRQLEKLQKQIDRQQAIIEKLSAEKEKKEQAAAPTAADEERIKRDVTAQIMRRIQPSLAAANKTFPAQFNPAIGFIIDTVGSYKEQERGNWEFRSGEIGISASVDPFARGYAIINGTSDDISVEEAAILTTSLPYNLTAKGGRFFADFGRLSKFHDHDLPFVNRPIVLDEYVGGESQADGVEGSWLVPISQYVNLTGGWYNKMGADNDRVDNTVPRNLSEFTYLGRGATFLNLSDANTVDLGTSWAYTPKVQSEDSAHRTLGGIDLTYRWVPLGQASYHGLTWGTEALWNSEDRPLGGAAGTSAAAAVEASLARGLGLEAPAALRPQAGGGPEETFQRRNAVGLYSYLEAKLTRRFYPGFLFQWVQDIDGLAGDTTSYSPYLTIWASEFQRFRLQYTRLEEPGVHENQFFLQWTVVLGAHVHGFTNR
jgi:hypothetical protein